MFIYFFLFGIIFLGLYFDYNKKNYFNNFYLFSYLFFLSFFIGFRFNVGGDFFSYFNHIPVGDYDKTGLPKELSTNQYNYTLFELMMIFSNLLNTKVYLANFFSALFFSMSLYFFVIKRPLPWFALIIAYPVLIMVLGMGFVRQGIALSFLLFAFNSLQHNKYFKYILLIIIGSLFHITILFFILLIFTKIKSIKISYLLIFLLILLISLLNVDFDQFQRLIQYYILDDSKPTSRGGIIRLTINIIPVFFFLKYYNNFKLYSADFLLLRYLCFFSIIVFLVSLIFPISTIADRIGLYLIPFQMIIYTNLIKFTHDIKLKFIYISFISLFYFVILFTWFNFADNSFSWLPYQNILLINIGDLTDHISSDSNIRRLFLKD